MSTLNALILAAHTANDKRALAELYCKASKTASSIDSACFLATQAYIFALECNHELQKDLYRFLKSHDREG